MALGYGGVGKTSLLFLSLFPFDYEVEILPKFEIFVIASRPEKPKLFFEIGSSSSQQKEKRNEERFHIWFEVKPTMSD